MKVTAAFGMATLALLSTACPSSPPPKAVPVTRARDVVPFIKDARLTKPVAFDGGKLRLDPISGSPKMSEQQALRRWLSAAGGMPGGVVLVYTRATLRIPVAADPNVGVKPRVVPVFKKRSAWAIFWYVGGPFSCPTGLPPAKGQQRPSRTPIPRNTPASQLIELLAADGSNEGIVYESGGRSGVCFQSVIAARAHPAWYVYSAPWRVGASGNPRETVVASPPPCSALWVIDGPENPHDVWTYQILTKKLMVKPPCSTDKAILTIDYVRSRGPYGSPDLANVQHPPTGPTLYTFEPPTIKYFDGATREFKTNAS